MELINVTKKQHLFSVENSQNITFTAILCRTDDDDGGDKDNNDDMVAKNLGLHIFLLRYFLLIFEKVLS